MTFRELKPIELVVRCFGRTDSLDIWLKHAIIMCSNDDVK